MANLRCCSATHELPVPFIRSSWRACADGSAGRHSRLPRNRLSNSSVGESRISEEVS
jgi:hypothetical protein